MEENYLVSVIVPVYNVETYLKETVLSIIHQTYKNIEIILINDGSNDSSGQICDQLAEEDSRVIVKHVENSGVSHARNLGLDVSKGEFISFVDADDTLETDMIAKMVNTAVEQHVDIVISNYLKYYSHSKKAEKYITTYQGFYEGDTFRDSVKNDYFSNNPNSFHTVCWSKLLKKSVIKDNNIRFDTNLKYGEDTLFIFECVMSADRFYVMDDNYLAYKYVQREESATSKFEEKEYFRRKYMVNKYKEILKIADLQELNKVYFYIAKTAFVSCSRISFKQNKNEIRNEISRIINDADFVKSLSYIEIRNLSLTDKLLYILFKNKMVKLLMLILNIKSKEADDSESLKVVTN